ncbi:MAG: hemolysin III family protein, partial [Treponema sp.]|nr:hemolysin III family protein [Treponema sp.]
MNKINNSSDVDVCPVYSTGEEITNSIIHGIGALLAVAGFLLLCLNITGVVGGQKEASVDIIAALVFVSAMFGMFLFSTLYHSIQHKGAKNILRRLDHSMIYILIAGTYTPFCLIALRGAWGWSILGVEWGLAIAGITLNFINMNALKKLKTAAYILMGWVILVGVIPLVRSVQIKTFIFLLIGGVVYTLGTIWYRKKNMKFSHAIWHSFVLIGAVCHWFAVWNLL